jgi:para-aminobenzoate synthetase component II
MILIIDNYDSFVHNLARYLRLLGHQTIIFRNDAITIEEIIKLQPSQIVLSPGPCTPEEAGISKDIIKYLGTTIPILGVCLGHQAIGAVFYGKIIRASQPVHGKSSNIMHFNQKLFNGISKNFTVGRYHSLIIDKHNFPDELIISSVSENGEIMSVEHKTLPIVGVQFHPESIMTEHGLKLLSNFLTYYTQSIYPQ